MIPKIQKWWEDGPERPVISNNEKIYGYFHLKGMISKIPHVLKGTRNFLWKTEELDNILKDIILVKFDAVGLYPNIPHQEGIQTI